MEPTLPRVAITYCTQCKWMLRAAYFGQELLSTFGTTIGEIALIPATGGLFQVQLTYKPSETELLDPQSSIQARTVLLWDRKAEGGFPETKILKQRVRDHLEPNRNLGHSDTPSSKKPSSDKPVPHVEEAFPAKLTDGVDSGRIGTAAQSDAPTADLNPDGSVCEDCK